MSTTVRQLRAIAQASRELPDPSECRRIRVDARISLRQLAEAAGASKAAVHTWEQGTRRPAGDYLIRYVRVLKSLRGSAA